MDAGILNKRITIYRDLGTSQTARGQHVEDWQEFHTCWAGVEHVESGDIVYGNKSTDVSLYNIILRYDPDKIVDNTMAIDFEGLKLSINGKPRVSIDKHDVFIRATNKDGETWPV